MVSIDKHYGFCYDFSVLSGYTQATLFQDSDAYFVQFPDELEPIPFSELAYSHEIGLYDKRKF